MTEAQSQRLNVIIRPMQYRDLEVVERLCDSYEAERSDASHGREKPPSLRRWFGLLKILSLFPNPFQYLLGTQVAEYAQRVRGLIQVYPFNRTRSTWRIGRVIVDEAVARIDSGAASNPPSATTESLQPTADRVSLSAADVGSLLLRYCFETIWEARTWLLEIDINDKAALALYRQNGFQQLAHMTYWEISAQQLQELAEREPDLPNLLPVSNADAQLLYQLDTVAMPPQVRQVFDRHIHDFKTSLFSSLMEWLHQWFSHTEGVSGYVFETQRKAAIGYFSLRLCRDGSQPHQAQLTVHPAYTWLYPELMSQMARIAQELPSQTLQLASSDYQPEREEYLERLGATRIAHTVMMSRSVWHKLRESKPTALEGLQLSEVLQNLQPARKPVPGRMSLLRSMKIRPLGMAGPDGVTDGPATSDPESQAGQGRLSVPADLLDPHRQDPCC